MIHPSQQQQPYTPRPASFSVTRGGTTRVYRFRPRIAGPALAVVTILLTAFVAATAYQIYRDDLLGAAVARQVAMQYAYEDRIEALRSEIDRTTSKQVLQTHDVEEQLALLLDRQGTILERQSELDRLVKRARDTGVEVAANVAPAARLRPEPASGSPAGAEPLAYAPAEAPAGSVITGTLIRSPLAGRAGGLSAEDVKPILFDVQASLDAAEGGQSETLEALAVEAQNEADKIVSTLAPLGLQPTTNKRTAPQGGPFIPAGGMHFVERAAMLNRTLDEIAGLRRSAQSMPLQMPVRAVSISSRFGYRDDPFLHRPALHAGLDFVAPSGTEVLTTAAGVVVSAGWSGGYGQMVEIKHAGGLSTRYAHLSAILVQPGTKVEVGAPIGRVGSTGRSTGPHLHYETRRDGEAVNPAPYLAAGRML
jgi:murein DD-endopeptidase MepM/ murein hydrolase activator NlpD